MIRTQANDDAVDSLSQYIVVVSSIELSKGGKTCCAHPVLEMFVLSQIGDV